VFVASLIDWNAKKTMYCHSARLHPQTIWHYTNDIVIITILLNALYFLA